MPFAERRANRVAQANPWIARKQQVERLAGEGGTPNPMAMVMAGMLTPEQGAALTEMGRITAETEALRQEMKRTSDPGYQADQAIAALYARNEGTPVDEWRQSERQELVRLEQQRGEARGLPALPLSDDRLEQLENDLNLSRGLSFDSVQEQELRDHLRGQGESEEAINAAVGHFRTPAYQPGRSPFTPPPRRPIGRVPSGSNLSFGINPGTGSPAVNAQQAFIQMLEDAARGDPAAQKYLRRHGGKIR
jgi:hypothetical protein